MRPSYHNTIVKEHLTLIGVITSSIAIIIGAIWLLIYPPQHNNKSSSLSLSQGVNATYPSGVSTTRHTQRHKFQKLRFRIQLPTPILNYDQRQPPYINHNERLISEKSNTNSKGFNLDVSNIMGRGSSIASQGGSESGSASVKSESVPSKATISPTSNAL